MTMHRANASRAIAPVYAEREEVSGTPEGDPGTVSRIAHDSLAAPSTEGVVPWLVRQKATVPGPNPGHFPRGESAARYLPTRRQVTVFRAPGGFGKTTLLGECCRSLMTRSVLTAWLSVDEQDAPAVFEAYLCFAFRQAGLDTVAAPRLRDGHPSGPGMGTLLHAIEAHDAPCVLALDEVERLSDPGSVALLNLLLERGPPNLHLAIACRDFPSGLEIGTPILEGRAVVVTAAQLRFSAHETAAFLGDRPAPHESGDPEQDCAGWPIALRIRRERQFGGTRAVAARDFGRTWLDSRMWRAMPDADRDLVLDAGLLDRIEPELLEEVLDGHAFWQRLEAMPTIDGLLLPAPAADGDARHMHPLLRQWCIEWRRRETPERFREVHRRIARALARRGSVVAAMRHAAEGDDLEFAASTLEDAGGLRFMIREGLGPLQAADRFLTPTILDRYPRLALARCAMLATTGRLDDARRLYARVVELAGGRVPSWEDPAQRDLYLDDLFARGAATLFSTASWSPEATDSLGTELAEVLARPDLDPTIRGAFEYGRCIMHATRGAFDEALACADRARRAIGHQWSHLPMLIDYQLGAIAMARGRAREAADWYDRARHALLTDFATDRGARMIGEVLARELDLERHGPTHLVAPVPVPTELRTTVPPFQVYAAASGAVIELARREHGIDRALAVAKDMIDYSHRENLPAVTRFLSITRVALLADAGRAQEASRAWEIAGLPEDDAGCLDCERQTWREMEALAEARLKLLGARWEFQEARRFADAVAEATERIGLGRTRMRCLAVSMAVEVAAGEGRRAAQHLAVFVRLFAESDYAGPLVRQREVSLPLLEDYMRRNEDPPLATAARELLGRLQRAVARPAGTALTEREREILLRLELQRDREIAKALSITHAGVRYHVRKIFGKLGARSRMDAVHRARRLGILPET